MAIVIFFAIVAMVSYVLVRRSSFVSHKLYSLNAVARQRYLIGRLAFTASIEHGSKEQLQALAELKQGAESQTHMEQVIAGSSVRANALTADYQEFQSLFLAAIRRPENKELPKQVVHAGKLLLLKQDTFISYCVDKLVSERAQYQNRVVFTLVIISAAFFATFTFLIAPEVRRVRELYDQIIKVQEEAEERARELAEQNAQLAIQDDLLKQKSDALEVHMDQSRLAALRFEELFQGLPVACFGFDCNGCIYDFNRSAVELFGVQAHEVIMEPFYDRLVSEKALRVAKLMISRVFSGRTVNGIEMEYCTPKGKHLVLLAYSFPLFGRNGEVTSAVAACVDITERKAAEAELNILSKISEMQTSGIAVCDAELRAIRVNQAFTEITGYSEAETIGVRPSSLLIGPETPELDTAKLREWLTATTVRSLETLVHKKSGEPVWMELTASPLYNKKGRLSNWIVTYTDITARKTAENELRILSKIAEIQTCGIAICDENIRTIRASEALCRITGYSEQEIIGQRPSSMMFHEGTPLEVRDELASWVTAKESRAIQFLAKRKQGDFVWIELLGSPIFDGDGKVAQWIGTFIDISERKQAEQALKESEETFRTMIETLHEGVVLIDKDLNILISNESASRILGYDLTKPAMKSSEVAGGCLKDDDSIYSDEERPVVMALNTGQPQFGKVMGIKSPNGDMNWILVNAVPIFEEGESLPVRVMSSFTDITVQRKQQHELELSYLQLELSNSQLTEKRHQLEATNAQLASLAFSDGLTGLFNHRAFQEKLADLCTSGEEVSMALLDVDHFKQFNDNFGHPAGDAVLKAVAKVLKGFETEEVFAARYGGEEFALVLKGFSPAQATEIANEACRQIAAHHWSERAITASFGVSSLQGIHSDPKRLIQEADQALYVSKHNGRNQVTHFNSLPIAA